MGHLLLASAFEQCEPQVDDLDIKVLPPRPVDEDIGGLQVKVDQRTGVNASYSVEKAVDAEKGSSVLPVWILGSNLQRNSIDKLHQEGLCTFNVDEPHSVVLKSRYISQLHNVGQS